MYPVKTEKEMHFLNDGCSSDNCIYRLKLCTLCGRSYTRERASRVSRSWPQFAFYVHLEREREREREKKCLSVRWNDRFKINALKTKKKRKKQCERNCVPDRKMFRCVADNRARVRFARGVKMRRAVERAMEE